MTGAGTRWGQKGGGLLALVVVREGAGLVVLWAGPPRSPLLFFVFVFGVGGGFPARSLLGGVASRLYESASEKPSREDVVSD